MHTPDKCLTLIAYCVKNIPRQMEEKNRYVPDRAKNDLARGAHSCEIMVGVIAAQEGGIGIRTIHHY